MKLPERVIKHICLDTVENRHVAFVKTDREGRVESRGGQLHWYGLDDLKVGEPISEQVDFLAGMMPLDGAPELLLAIEVRAGSFADAHLLPGEDADWVLLFDANDRTSLHQVLQQRSNESSLLREQLEKEKSASGEIQRIRGTLDQEQRKTQNLLHNLLPEPIIERLNRGEQDIVDRRPNAVFLEVAVHDFPALVAERSLGDAAKILGEVMAIIESSANKSGAVWLKSLGPACFLGTGILDDDPDPVAMAKLAFALASRFAGVKFAAGGGERGIALSMALTAGPVTAGVVGFDRFAFEVWGEAVGEAGWLCRQAAAGEIVVSSTLAAKLEGHFTFASRSGSGRRLVIPARD